MFSLNSELVEELSPDVINKSFSKFLVEFEPPFCPSSDGNQRGRHLKIIKIYFMKIIIINNDNDKLILLYYDRWFKLRS